jgi:hypothetical protein
MEVEMPSFLEFATALELARRHTRAAGHADPVAQYVMFDMSALWMEWGR